MSRRLNIERRRKRIRHYRAQRRRRSPAWRALLFWWAPALVCLLAGLALAQTVALFWGRPGFLLDATWTPPEMREPGLGMVWATADEAQALRRRLGNVRRRAGALQDADIGISFAQEVPEPVRLDFEPFGPLPQASLAQEAPTADLALPPAAESVAVAPRKPFGLRTTAEGALREVGYVFDWKPPAGRGYADFLVTLGPEGRPETVARLAPKGPETAALRGLRRALEAGRGEGPAQGIVRVRWETESEATP